MKIHAPDARPMSIVVRSAAVSDPLSQQMNEFAARTVDQVRAALGVELGYDSETLPIIDHYLRSVPHEQAATVMLIATSAGAYFGEVVRRVLGGRWDGAVTDPTQARLILPWGLSFSPAGVVAATIFASDTFPAVDVTLDASFHAPDVIQPHLQAALARMSPVTDEIYYSLCGRFDTLEHLQEVVLAAIAVARNRSNTES